VTGVLLDNDVVLKVCAYRCSDSATAVATIEQTPPGMLSIGQFTLRSILRKPGRLADPESARAEFEALLPRLRMIEPDETEIDIAADLEERAVAMSLEFDPGESQLLAVLLQRRERMLVTGDKRAIAAISGLEVAEADGRIACLEQLIAAVVGDDDPAAMRRHVCAEPAADRAVTACFGCSAPSIRAEDVQAGLRSYSSDLRRRAGACLAAGDRLAIVS
jgi:hypothetical protein